ncbi:MAG: glycosyltransferase, partial [archaeon]
TLERLYSFVKNQKEEWEILIVNDGSKDKTLEILEGFRPKFFKILSYNPNRGKGFAIKTGVKKASGEFICFTDSDLAYSFENLKQAVLELEKYDLCIGSRSLANTPENAGLLREITGRGFRIISFLILGYNIKDKQCGLKAFRRDVAKDLFFRQKINGFSFDSEILYLSKKRKYILKEIPAVTSIDHSYKDSKINLLKEPIKMFLDLLKIRLNDIRGKYE